MTRLARDILMVLADGQERRPFEVCDVLAPRHWRWFRPTYIMVHVAMNNLYELGKLEARWGDYNPAYRRRDCWFRLVRPDGVLPYQ